MDNNLIACAPETGGFPRRLGEEEITLADGRTIQLYLPRYDDHGELITRLRETITSEMLEGSPDGVAIIADYSNLYLGVVEEYAEPTGDIEDPDYQVDVHSMLQIEGENVQLIREGAAGYIPPNPDERGCGTPVIESESEILGKIEIPSEVLDVFASATYNPQEQSNQQMQGSIPNMTEQSEGRIM